MLQLWLCRRACERRKDNLEIHGESLGGLVICVELLSLILRFPLAASSIVSTFWFLAFPSSTFLRPNENIQCPTKEDKKCDQCYVAAATNKTDNCGCPVWDCIKPDPGTVLGSCDNCDEDCEECETVTDWTEMFYQFCLSPTRWEGQPHIIWGARIPGEPARAP